MDLAGAQVEVDVVVGEDAGEALDDAARLDGGRGDAARSWRSPGGVATVGDAMRRASAAPAAPRRASTTTRACRQLDRDAVVPPVHAGLALGAGGAGRELVEVGLLELAPAGRSSLPVLSLIGPAKTSNRPNVPASILASVSLTLHVGLGQVGDARLRASRRP